MKQCIGIFQGVVTRPHTCVEGCRALGPTPDPESDVQGAAQGSHLLTNAPRNPTQVQESQTCVTRANRSNPGTSGAEAGARTDHFQVSTVTDVLSFPLAHTSLPSWETSGLTLPIFSDPNELESSPSQHEPSHTGEGPRFPLIKNNL